MRKAVLNHTVEKRKTSKRKREMNFIVFVRNSCQLIIIFLDSGIQLVTWWYMVDV